MIDLTFSILVAYLTSEFISWKLDNEYDGMELDREKVRNIIFIGMSMLAFTIYLLKEIFS